ncbi:unnamed protein product [Adineta steineri]|uniref:AMOP domain-containing protein n=1 Tax=Adineta steineri TaxID=433720 RepID=A0A814PG27_9BILA|nr:unnamed protein product [Adineta steineri]CAF1105866.1 unnamed protein product [Adineta steineri]
MMNALLHSSEVEESNEENASDRGLLSCLLWNKLEGDPTELLKKVLKPPYQVPSTFPRQLNEGAYGCYRFAYSNTGSGAQACYDKNGNFISDPWRGGSTVDQETLSGDLIQSAKHVACDIVPYSCCQTFFSPQSYTCNLYYEKRPTGQCENKTAI